MEPKRVILPLADAFNKPYRGYANANDYYKELKVSKTGYANLRKKLLSGQNFQCAYCLCNLKGRRMNVEHVKAIKRGGSNHLSNLVAACSQCNKEKGNRDLKKRELESLKANLKKLKRKSYRKQRNYTRKKEESIHFIPDEMRHILKQEW